MATKPASPSLQVGNSLSTGLVVGLMLGEGSGSTSTDLTGNGHDATLSGGASWTTDAAGNAVACTGGGALDVTLPAVASGDDFTLCIIHKPTTWPGGFTLLVDDSGRVWSDFFDTGGSRSFYGTLQAIGGHEAMSAGTLWQFVYTREATMGGGGSTGIVYANGSQTDTGAGGLGAATSHAVSFGANPSGGGSTYDGLYDAIYLWNRALSGADVTSLQSDPYQMFRPSGGGGNRRRRTIILGGD